MNLKLKILGGFRLKPAQYSQYKLLSDTDL